MMRLKRLKGIALLSVAGTVWMDAAGAAGTEWVSGFEELLLSGGGVWSYSGPGGGVYWNGSDGSGGFSSDGGGLWDLYNTDWMSWTGWAYSTTADVTTPGFGNQYSAFSGGAGSGSAYAVAYLGFGAEPIELASGWRAPQSVKVTNTTYAGLAMRDGQDGFMNQTQFGQGDYYKLTFIGYDMAGQETGRVEVMLADYRGAPGTHYVLSDWQQVDLQGLGTGVARIGLELESTDVGTYGINTPTYVAIDDLVLGATVPEPSAFAILAGLVGLCWVALRRERGLS